MAQTEEKYNFKNRQSWQEGLNASPKEKWIRTRELGGNKKSKYLPIPVQQALADVFFNEFDIFDEKYEEIQNEILCTVKIQILPSYPNSEHRIISGTGAKPIQMDKGKKPIDYPKFKKLNSLEYCAPASRTMAISNALTTFGNVFGRNIGRTLVSNGYKMPKNK